MAKRIREERGRGEQKLAGGGVRGTFRGGRTGRADGCVEEWGVDGRGQMANRE
jgi:hypothetical protein